MTNKSNPQFLGCLSSSQAYTLYSILVLSFSLLTLSNLPSSNTLLFESESGEEEEEENLVKSRTVLELSIVFSKLLAQSGLAASLISLAGTILVRDKLQIPLQIQALVNLFISSAGSFVLGTLYLSPSLLTSASYELCTFAIGSDSLPSLSRTPDYSLPSSISQSFAYFWPSSLMGENCDERASAIVLPTLLLLSLCSILHFHLLYVFFSPSFPISSSPSLLPLHHPSKISTPKTSSNPATQLAIEKNLIIL